MGKKMAKMGKNSKKKKGAKTSKNGQKLPKSGKTAKNGQKLPKIYKNGQKQTKPAKNCKKWQKQKWQNQAKMAKNCQKRSSIIHHPSSRSTMGPGHSTRPLQTCLLLLFLQASHWSVRYALVWKQCGLKTMACLLGKGHCKKAAT